MNTTLIMEGLELFAHHGLFEEAKRLGQRFRFDLRAEIATVASHSSDDLAGSVDYGLLVERIEHVAIGERFQTLEALAEALGRDMLGQFPCLSRVSVKAAKTAPPLRFNLSAVGVEISISRRELEIGA